MSNPLSRREFIKLSSLALATTATKFIMPPGRILRNGDAKNILIILFDAWSAKHISLYGYQRETTPHLARLAKRATVYHNHFAGANWTYPGTSTLLTGVSPLAHRGFSGSERIVKPFDRVNIFSQFDDYYRLAYTHNPIAETVLDNFMTSIEEYIPHQQHFLQKQQLIGGLFSNDYDVASLSFVQTLKRYGVGFSYSLFLGALNNEIYRNKLNEYSKQYPLGPPEIENGNFFLLEDAVDAIAAETQQLPAPYLAYYHLLPPHAVYKPRRDFWLKFNGDGFQPPIKPLHFMGNQANLDSSSFRRLYDEYVLNVDAEFGRLFDLLDSNGTLDDTWVILTSDHGEMFERGIVRHRTPVFHQPVIQAPLMIFEPGKKERRDVYQPTSATDVLPTLLHVTGRDIPGVVEGLVLPPYGPEIDDWRAIYALDARHNASQKPLEKFSVMLLKWPYKLMYYQGHDRLDEGQEIYEMYDLESDPEELTDIYDPLSSVAKMMVEELLAEMDEADAPYR